VVQRFRQAAARRRRGDPVLLDGDHLIEEALAAGVRLDAVLVADADVDRLARYREAGAQIYHAAPAVLDAASPVKTPSGIVALAVWSPAPLAAILRGRQALAIGLVDVQDPGNVGGVIRSADALGASGVAAIGQTADPGGWKAMRGAMGSTFRLPVARESLDTALAAAASARVRTLATVASGGTPLDAADLRGPVFALLGNEGAGLPASIVRRADDRLHIPMRAGVDSLNVAVSAALVMYEARRQRRSRP
jgi:TrmH family RNA methyltransferase